MQKPPNQSARYLEVNGSPVGAGLVGRIFNRWSAPMLVCAASAFYMAADESDRKALRTQMPKDVLAAAGLAVAQRFYASFLTKSYFKTTHVIDTQPARYTTIMRLNQQRAMDYCERGMPDIKSHVVVTAATLPFTFMMLPACAEYIQTRQMVKNLASGKWALIQREDMVPTQTGNTPASP